MTQNTGKNSFLFLLLQKASHIALSNLLFSYLFPTYHSTRILKGKRISVFYCLLMGTKMHRIKVVDLEIKSNVNKHYESRHI